MFRKKNFTLKIEFSIFKTITLVVQFFPKKFALFFVIVLLNSVCFCIFQEVRKYLKECIQIFSYEPTCIQEGRLAAIARLDLVELETYVDTVEKSE